MPRDTQCDAVNSSNGTRCSNSLSSYPEVRDVCTGEMRAVKLCGIHKNQLSYGSVLKLHDGYVEKGPPATKRGYRPLKTPDAATDR